MLSLALNICRKATRMESMFLIHLGLVLQVSNNLPQSAYVVLLKMLCWFGFVLMLKMPALS